MKHLIFTVLLALAYSLAYSQTQEKQVDSLKKSPIIFVDSVLVSWADLKKYDPNDIASVTVYKYSPESKNYNSQADETIYVETKQFSTKRFLKYFKSRSQDFNKLLASQQSDNSFQYILNGEVLNKDYEGKLAAINDKDFKSITIIRKDELVNKYGNTDKTFGIVIVSDVPEYSPVPKEKL